jgi:flavin reductase (DIM6/NTAB) family NADH-FMN oxidoreductase RutF
MKELPLSKVLTLIEPGPVVLLTTCHKEKINVMTMSWLMMMEFTPQIGCIVSSENYSFDALRKTKECVISIPTADIINTVVDIGNCSGKDVDKFEKFGLTPLPEKNVKSTLISQCLANIECRLIDSSLINKYNLFIWEGVAAWIDQKRKERRTIHAKGDGTFVIDGDTVNLRKRMVKWKDLIASI